MTVVLSKMTEADRKQLLDFKLGPNLTRNQIDTFTQFVRASAVVWHVVKDGRCLTIAGVMPPTISSNAAYLWMYIVEADDQVEFLTVRHSKRVIEETLKDYPLIVGHCQRGNDRAIRWIKWLGGIFGDYEYDFIPFRIERKHG